MQYPLTERIGNPDLLAGREKEFALFDKWIAKIPKRLSKSRVILARRKSGKTAIVQRIFNRLWTENGEIIPFYFSFPEAKKWYPELAVEYYSVFASHYISFIERDAKIVDTPLEFDAIYEYGKSKSVDLLVRDIDSIKNHKENKMYGLMWKTAYTAPERFASYYEKRILVILDEFQNITQYIYHDKERKTEPDETLAGSFHDSVESKIAPMLVTGSYVGWLISVIDKYLEAGRLKRMFMNPCLTSDEGLQAVYKYSQVYDEPVTNETAEQINRLCMSDPFFISCVIMSDYEDKDLCTQEGVVNTVNYEITDKSSEMSMTWGEYLELTLKKVNDRYAKTMLLHLSKHSERDWSHRELKQELKLEIGENEIQEKLEIMVMADVITKGASAIRYQGLQDGSLNLILRHRFEEEINDFMPELKQDFNKELEKLKADKQSLQGRLNNLSGKFAEFQLFTEFRSRKRFALHAYFDGVNDKTVLNITEARMRYKFQRKDGKDMEIDVMALSNCGRTVLVEVKKTKDKSGIGLIKNFQEKIDAYSERFPGEKILPGFLSIGGFTKEALGFCGNNGIGTAVLIRCFQDSGGKKSIQTFYNI